MDMDMDLNTRRHMASDSECEDEGTVVLAYFLEVPPVWIIIMTMIMTKSMRVIPRQIHFF